MPKIIKIGQTLISPWQLVRFTICLDGIQALDMLYNSSHTSVLNRGLFPEVLVSLIPQKEKNRWNWMTPEYLHERDSQSVSTEFKRLIFFIINPIQASWTDHSFLKSWPVELPRISEISRKKPHSIRMIFGLDRSAWSALQSIPYCSLDSTTSAWIVRKSMSLQSAKLTGKRFICSSPIGTILDCLEALDWYYNSSHTFVLARPVLPKALISWISTRSSGYSDADYGSDPNDRLSYTTAKHQTLYVKWRTNLMDSHKQSTVAHSTMGAEYMALSN